MSSLGLFFTLSKTVMDPKAVGLSPFFAPPSERESKEPPHVLRSLRDYAMCTKRALNVQIIRFGEPSLKSCVDEFVISLRASVESENGTASLEQVCRRRRGVVDPTNLPWEPREEYLAWLGRQNRLAEGDH
ncbi:hypothetical protein STCU_01875 [Strigomonas culicis]|uniref:Uncharacterized protein n=1 Tax=Strigomonas culicis TaxID=28005 RepID=S9W3G3_9TRYP|nr:hypothetical protein STCU_07356 [Strigomonas culicis]EPY33891.1 hypothetical protein STCU_01875 [Strigomonas culicis]|eukprot:EPY24015.1 hypothetical protein STCU_07356 [Strigomonas culicis]